MLSKQRTTSRPILSKVILYVAAWSRSLQQAYKSINRSRYPLQIYICVGWIRTHCQPLLLWHYWLQISIYCESARYLSKVFDMLVAGALQQFTQQCALCFNLDEWNFCWFVLLDTPSLKLQTRSPVRPSWVSAIHSHDSILGAKHSSAFVVWSYDASTMLDIFAIHLLTLSPPWYQLSNLFGKKCRLRRSAIPRSKHSRRRI